MISIETLDLDGIGYADLRRITERIRLHGCRVLSAGPSAGLDGFHIYLRCYCGVCRLVFDDNERFRRDSKRPRYAQNVIFETRRRKLYLRRYKHEITGNGLMC